MTSREQSADRGARVGAELRALAEAATPGPWALDEAGVLWTAESYEIAVMIGMPAADKDAAFIAAANPATVLALLDRLEAAEAKVARVEAKVARVEAHLIWLAAERDRIRAAYREHNAGRPPDRPARRPDLATWANAYEVADRALRGALGEQGATSAEETL